jgi:hypothetical protein
VKLHQKKNKDPKLTRIKLKTPKLQNTKTKDLQSSQEENQIPHLPLVKLHTKKLKIPKMTRRKLKIRDSEY